MTGRRYPQPRFRNGPTIAALEAQVASFRLKVDTTQARLDRLKAGSTPFTRPAGIASRILSVEDDLAGAKQGLLNAERILQTAKATPGYDGAVAESVAIPADALNDDLKPP